MYSIEEVFVGAKKGGGVEEEGKSECSSSPFASNTELILREFSGIRAG